MGGHTLETSSADAGADWGATHQCGCWQTQAAGRASVLLLCGVVFQMIWRANESQLVLTTARGTC